MRHLTAAAEVIRDSCRRVKLVSMDRLYHSQSRDNLREEMLRVVLLETAQT
jgi:hypothetical protein